MIKYVLLKMSVLHVSSRMAPNDLHMLHDINSNKYNNTCRVNKSSNYYYPPYKAKTSRPCHKASSSEDCWLYVGYNSSSYSDTKCCNLWCHMFNSTVVCDVANHWIYHCQVLWCVGHSYPTHGYPTRGSSSSETPGRSGIIYAEQCVRWLFSQREACKPHKFQPSNEHTTQL